MADPNIEMLRSAVAQLGELCDELVFVGGSTTGLFITDPAATQVAFPFRFPFSTFHFPFSTHFFVI